MPRAPDLSGRVLDDRYEIHDLIGEGTFGRVYRGHDRRLRRAVAVKVIKPWWADDPEWVGRFEREAQLLASVSDPGIVQIFDVGHADEGLYYVAELIDGESLAQRLRRGPLPPAEAARIAELLCRALARAHEQRIVHRDVKPANILLARGGRVTVGDFGVAQLAEGSPHGAAATALGTPRYMSPEHAGGRATSAASDVYAVGVVLHEMLTGAPPFPGEVAVEVAVRHLQEPPPALPESVPDDLARVVARALAKDPDDRYRDGGEMARALAQVRAGLPRRDGVDDSPPALDGPEEAPASVAATSVAATSVLPPEEAPTSVAATSVAATSVLPPADATQVDSRPSPAPRPPRPRRAFVPLLMVAALVAVGAALLIPGSETTVPELRGLSRDGASARAGRYDLRTRFDRRYSSSTPKGVSLTQDPAAGSRVGEGSTVRVTLSDGPAPVAVPAVTGSDLDSARQALDVVGLRSSVREAPAEGAKAGTVLKQSPAPPARAVPGSTVKLTVAQTPRWRTVTSFEALDDGRSVPFRIRGERWRVIYSMEYEGRCTLLLVCFGPGAVVKSLPAEDEVESWDLDRGSDRTRTFRTDPGIFQITVSGGDDAARWSMSVQDFY